MPGTLYGVALSQPTRSCLLLIKEANLDIAYEEVNMMAGAHKQEPFISINPAGQLPAFADGDFKLAEGAAILTYIAESNNLADWYPTDPKARAKINQWLHWNHTNTRQSTKQMMFPTLFGGEVDCTGFTASLSVLEKTLENSKFVASSDHPTLGDLFVLPELDQVDADFLDVFDFTPYPNIVRYLSDIKAALPSYEENKANCKPFTA